MKRNIFRLLLSTVLMMCCTVMASAQNSNATKINNIWYLLDGTNKTATVTWGGEQHQSTTEYTGIITIPSTVNDGNQDYSVTAIGDYAFEYCSELTSITIPGGVTSIGPSAFNDCVGLTSVSLPESLKSIGYTAFYNCYKIFRLEVPDGVTAIGDNAFVHIQNVIYEGNATDNQNKNNWGAIALNGYVEGDFVYDSPLKKKFCAVSCSFTGQLVIPEGVEEIGGRAIFHSSVSSVVIPSTLKTVESHTFHQADNITDLFFLTITPPEITESCFMVGSLNNLTDIYVLDVNAYKNWSGLTEEQKNIVTSYPLVVLINLYKNLLANKKNTANLTDVEKSAVDGYITGIENTTEALAALKIYAEAIIYILMNDVDYLIDQDINAIKTHIATIKAATDMGAVATAQAAAISIINTRPEKNTAIAELQSFINDNKIANAQLDGYIERINNATSTSDITGIFNDIKSQINNYKKFTLGDRKYLLDDNNGECTIVGGSLTFTDKDLYKSDHNFTVTGGITYNRIFTNTNWQPLYVPFAISYSDWEYDFEVAAINNFHEYTNDMGQTVKTELEIRMVKSGKLKPNHPYLIKAHDAAAEPQEINLTTKKISKSDEKSYSCSSMESQYTFTGTYQEMNKLKTNDYIFMSGGKLCKAENDEVVLSSQRWYLKITSLGSQVDGGNTSYGKPMEFDIKLLDDEPTGIDEITVTRTPLMNSVESIYNLNGMRVNGNYKGIVIKNGKKIYQR